MRHRVSRLEFSWQVLSLLLLLGAIVPLWREVTVGRVGAAVGDPVQRLVLAGAFLPLLLASWRTFEARRTE